jgi:hypothetical protein
MKLMLLFVAIFVVMVWINLKAALGMDILVSSPLFGAKPWGVATLYDAYCGFLRFYLWVAYQERAVWARALWCALVMGLGNVAMPAYVLKELSKLKPEEPVWKLLQNRPA